MMSIREQLLWKCAEQGFENRKLRILFQRVQKMLERQADREPEMPTRTVVYCEECNTTDPLEDLIHDRREGQMICKYCGIVVNYNLMENVFDAPTLNSTEEDFYGPQHRFETVMIGGSKKLRALCRRTNETLKAPDGTTTEKYKDHQRDRVYDFLQQLAEELNLPTDLVFQGKVLFNKARQNAARLHSPEAVMLVCLLMVEERSEKSLS